MTFTKVRSSRLRVTDKGGKDQLKLTELKIRGLSAEIESNVIQQSPKSNLVS